MEDPDLAQLHRSLAMADAQPRDEIGESLSPEQVIQDSVRIRDLIAHGQLREAWDRRLQLGYGVSREGVPQSDWFWLNADPAIAALKLGFKDHPAVAMCCGVAEEARDRSDPEQVAAVAEFNRLFFG